MRNTEHLSDHRPKLPVAEILGLSAEEHQVIGGLGGAVAEIVGEAHPCPVLRVGMQDKFGESGTPAEVMAKYGHSAEKIAETAETLMKNCKCG